MFRALLLFPAGAKQNMVTMDAPLSVTLVEGDANSSPPVNLSIRPDGVFTTAVGHRGKRTLAVWHVTTPQEVVDHMLELAGVKDDRSAEEGVPKSQL